MAGTPGREGSERDRGVQSLRPLHNFTLPNHLKWGHQKQLRCVNSTTSIRHRSQNPADYASPSPPPSSDHSHHNHHRSNSSLHPTILKPRNKDKSPIDNSGGDATVIESGRERVTSDVKVAADQLKLPILDEEKSKNNLNADEKKPSEEELPWNLRTRRAAGKRIFDGGNSGSRKQGKGIKGLAAVAAADKGEAGGSGEQSTPPRPKFSLTLTKEEIEADFLLMTGAKPPRRPKRRPKNVQKQLNPLVPGGWLTEVTPESYRVPDTPDAKVQNY